MMPKIKKTFFANAWLTDIRFSSWVSISTDSTKADYKLCKKDFSLSNTQPGNPTTSSSK